MNNARPKINTHTIRQERYIDGCSHGVYQQALKHPAITHAILEHTQNEETFKLFCIQRLSLRELYKISNQGLEKI
jgi:hypothetical protein